MKDNERKVEWNDALLWSLWVADGSGDPGLFKGLPVAVRGRAGECLGGSGTCGEPCGSDFCACSMGVLGVGGV